jgi:hypothetical protein
MAGLVLGLKVSLETAVIAGKQQFLLHFPKVF